MEQLRARYAELLSLLWRVLSRSQQEYEHCCQRLGDAGRALTAVCNHKNALQAALNL